MSRIKRSSLLVIVALALCGAMTSCKDDDLASDEHYQAPDWLKGNAYEVMQKDGNHTIFLRAIDLSDYQEIVAGKSILTVVAPSDDAFRKFLTDKGYSSIEDLDKQDHAYLNKLVGYHLMYYAFDWNKMVNFRPTNGDGATDDQLAVFAGYYYKHRTHAQDPIENVTAILEGTTPQDIKVYHNELYLPVLSNKLFETKGIDGAYNYNYFYPDTKWNGGGVNGGFNIANAAVEGDAVVTDNGYLYNVDHVVEPLNTIYGEMALNPKYSKFLAIYDSYATFSPASDEINSTLGYQAYLRSYDGVPNIASEWISPSWLSVSVNEQAGYNVFAPSNTAIDNFFKNFWTQESGYTAVEELDPLILRFFVYQSFASEAMIKFPEEIKRGDVENGIGGFINIDPDQVTDRKICANGAFYGMDNMDLPAVFTSVAGPVFKDTDFRWYLYLLDKADRIFQLSAKGANYVALVPSNAQLGSCEPQIMLRMNEAGNTLLQYNEDSGSMEPISQGTCRNIADIHVATNVEELKTTGTQVIATNVPYNYWYLRDGRLTTNALFNQQLRLNYNEDPFVDIHPVLNNGHNWDNGAAYTYDSPTLFEQAKGDGLGHTLAVGNDKNYKYYMFSQLLIKAGLIDSKTTALDKSILPSDEERFILFAPTNEALIKAIEDKAFPGADKFTVTDGSLTGTVTGTTKTNLANYLRRYFVSSLTNIFSDYPYVGSSCNGAFMTVANEEKLVITDNGASLTVGLEGKTPVNVTADFGYLPFAFSDGCLHFIDGIL